MRLIELHILQSFPVTCLNRDDVGAPKSAFFGGVLRARVSSQCWKRAIRLLCHQIAEARNVPRFQGIRTRDVGTKLRAILQTRLTDPIQVERVAHVLADQIGRAAAEGDARTKVLLFFSPKQLQAVVDQVCATIDLQQLVSQELVPAKGRGKKDDPQAALQDAVKKALKALKTPPEDAADIAIFGRMVASDPELTLEGAGLFSHALSTHEVANDIDFFSAVDDLRPEEEAGAGHIGTLEFNTACYYRYVGLNWDLLSDRNHLGPLTPADRKAILDVFLRAALLAVPQARKNSMFGFTPPGAILGLVRDGQPLSLANAFEVPVRSQNGYLARSRERLEEHYAVLKQVFDLAPIRELWLILDGGQTEPKVGKRVENLDAFINSLLEGLPNE
ncbi:MAG: type I-E CRISPR-associated protein Cas7/Cse4/CasC [Thermoguttaceae bacterium]|nr:type I-E CRISPR-associated protein Cas7/Cse4/CasC [Thermoguttaceae bacterium]MDW8079854.1 type I-E CRISPR-associated protein Cas7/Cse4/CasC [Thermoguttaceae bacterium]